MKILNFGSLNIDYVYRVPRMVCPKETLACDGMEQFLGGKGFNQSVALARAGAPVFHAGLIGEDGGVFLDACREYGIDAGHIRRIPGRSGHTIIQVDPAGENCILLYGGANRALDEAYIEQVLADFSAGDILLLQNEVNCLDVLIRAAHRRGYLYRLFCGGPAGGAAGGTESAPQRGGGRHCRYPKRRLALHPRPGADRGTAGLAGNCITERRSQV